MRTLIALFAFAACATAQTTVTVTLTVAGDATSTIEAARLAGPATNYTLAASITAAATSVQLTDATTPTPVPASGQLVIDSEAVNFTYSGSGNTLTITKRGATITTAAAHAQGAVVRVLTYPTINALAKWALYQYFRGVLLQSPTAAMQTAQAQVTASLNAVESAISTAVQ